MSIKQTRRAISCNPKTYDDLKEFCEEHACSMSGVVDTLIRSALDLAPNLNIDERIRTVVEARIADSKFLECNNGCGQFPHTLRGMYWNCIRCGAAHTQRVE